MKQWALGVLFLSTFVGGCSLETSEGALEDLGVAQEEIVIGNWVGPFSNGNAGPNPELWKQGDGKSVVICEVYEAGDGRYHPGKLWGGNCRYEYDGGVRYGNNYMTLQKTAGTTWVANQGFTPSKAIGSNGLIQNSLAVCSTRWGTGKVWGGVCFLEWAGNDYAETSFNFLVKP